ncbi:restriction endonuclease subunit S [Chryseobacterium sp. 3008163]|uniref:restriction endonuclease subunit S n=1 Tax=Chryseobacterium sp. 3008163 TaxID=2478663 RepID=UPI000F0C998A|nr:restriction endonuclease subunit S [Chryseobacterium sp. 3008163]AYM99752.1 restriction endonuclease subunit S [Chryseobacterium sp. 3008163]
MREGWKDVKLGELFKIGSSKRIYLSDYVDKGIPFYRSKEIIENYKGEDISNELFITNEKYEIIKDKYGIPNENDIILTSVGTIGIPFIVDKRKFYFKDGNLIWLHCGNSKILDSKYLYYFISSNNGKAKLDSILIGSSQKALTIEGLKKIVINLPPTETQRKIASILSGYDDLIENNLKRIKLLEEMAQQTYEEWFVRMRFPSYETAVFDENGLPEGWEKLKLGDLCEKIFDGTHDSPKQTESGFKLITGKHLQKGKVDFETAYNISEEDHFKIKKRSGLVKNDIMYSNIGTIGNLSMVYEDFEYSCKNMIVFRPKKNFEYFIYTYLFNENTKNKILGEASGSTQKFISLGYIRNYDDIFPTIELISKFNEYCNSIYKSINNLNTQNQRLSEARDILLPRLMMGMIDVSGSSAQLVESLETKPTETKIIPLEQPKKEASKEFKEAVLIACLTERFGSEKFPLGRKRYTKLSYLFHRYSDNKIQDYLRKAAGPYNPKTKYGGPEKIAINNKYIQNWKSDNKLTGFVSAEKIEDAKTYFSNYWQISNLDWLTAEFKFKSNDELELLATVDNSLLELSKKNLEFTSSNVLDIIKSEKEWEAKLERTIFSDANVERAIGFLRGVLEYG